MTYEQPAPRTSGLAITALILGLLSFCLGPITGIIAAILGFTAYAKIRNDPAAKGSGLALTGAITGIVGTLLILVIALPVAILIPSLQRARTFAQRAEEQSRMHQIAMACTVYSSEYDGAFPPHLAAVVASGIVDPKMLVARGHTAMSMPPASDPRDWRTIAPAIDADCQFVYTGADLRESRIRDLTSTIVLYSKTASAEGRNIAFADGHTEFIRTVDLLSVFANCNRARADMKLPPIMLDGPPPTAERPRLEK